MATGDPWVFKQQQLSQPVLSVNAPDNNIVFKSGSDEMLRVAQDGFYVRGIKLEQDDKEATEVYNAFKQWLAWSVLNNQQ